MVLIALLLSGCAGPAPKLRHLIYDSLAPPAQTDHPASEMGQHALARARENGDYEKIGIFPSCEYPLRERQRINPEANVYVILQIDGGGIMGITPAVLVEKLESALKARGNNCGRIRDVVSICSGSSTGAVIAGAVAAGIPAEDIAQLYRENGYQLYLGEGRLKRPKPFQFKLDREKFQEVIYRELEESSPYCDPQITLREMSDGPLLIITAFDLVTRRTIFLRTRGKFGVPIGDSENVQLADAISASAFSGAYVFGRIPCPTIETTHFQADGEMLVSLGAVFADGGQGTQNSTLSLAAMEALEIMRSDPDAQVLLISMGCGNTFVDEYNYTKKDRKRFERGLPVDSLKKRSRSARFDEVVEYDELQEILATGISVKNQARGEAIRLQLMGAQSISETLTDPDGFSKLLVYRFDFEPLLPSGFPVSDYVTAFHITEEGREFLLSQAEEISRWESFEQLTEVLSNPDIQLRSYRP